MNTKEELTKNLNNTFRERGYVTIDEIINLVDEADLPLHEVDRLCERLQNNGVIILEENEINNSIESGTIVDKSRIDYNEIFNRVIDIDPCLKEYINEIRFIPPPQLREEFALIQQAKDGNPYAKDRIIKMYLKIVVRIALQYYDRYSLPLAETIQDGNVGLVKALVKMPDFSDQRFSTYAPWWIRQVIERSTLGLTNDFYIPFHLKQKLYVIVEISKDHYCEECSTSGLCKCLIEQICMKIDLDYKSVTDLLNIVYSRISIDEYSLDDSVHELFTDFGEKETSMIEELFTDQIISIIFTSLNEKESRVLKYRYGIYDGIDRTLEEVGNIFGVTRERIRQIESKAIKKLKRSRKFKPVKRAITS